MTTYNIDLNVLKIPCNSCMDLTQLLIGIFEKFFHYWKPDIMAGKRKCACYTSNSSTGITYSST